MQMLHGSIVCGRDCASAAKSYVRLRNANRLTRKPAVGRKRRGNVMSYTTNTAAQRPGIMHAAMNAFEGARTRMAQRRAYRQTVNALSQLTNHELDDLGLSRSTIQSDAWQAVYGTRPAR
jgi:uncharacterized protein YjiS (DUF1127 family)